MVMNWQNFPFFEEIISLFEKGIIYLTNLEGYIRSHNYEWSMCKNGVVYSCCKRLSIIIAATMRTRQSGISKSMISSTSVSTSIYNEKDRYAMKIKHGDKTVGQTSLFNCQDNFINLLMRMQAKGEVTGKREMCCRK